MERGLTLLGGDAWIFSGRVGQEVIITLDSPNGALDPYLVLLGPNGSVISENDDGGGDLNSRINIILPEEGQYLIFARGFASRNGDYIINLSQPESAKWW